MTTPGKSAPTIVADVEIEVRVLIEDVCPVAPLDLFLSASPVAMKGHVDENIFPFVCGDDGFA